MTDGHTWVPEEGHPLPGTSSEYPLISVPIKAITRFELDKLAGGLCFWAMWESPFDAQLNDHWNCMAQSGALISHAPPCRAVRPRLVARSRLRTQRIRPRPSTYSTTRRRGRTDQVSPRGPLR